MDKEEGVLNQKRPHTYIYLDLEICKVKNKKNYMAIYKQLINLFTVKNPPKKNKKTSHK